MSANHPNSSRRTWLTAVLLCVSMTGCAYFWDDVTSKEFKLAKLWHKDDPMEVLLNSTDNYQRARAITQLQEPKQSGGSDKDQERILLILQKTAQGDPDSYCRLAAIATLGRFKDPKGVDILDNAFQEKLPFDAEKNVLIRKQILVSMAQNESPKSLQRFVLVARQPAGVREAPSEARAILDERMTAVRALAKYKNKEVSETLVHLLETERDISLKACAHGSLQEISGTEMPADAKLWREYLTTGKQPKFDSPSWFAKTRDKYLTSPNDKGILPDNKTPAPVITAGVKDKEKEKEKEKLADFKLPEMKQPEIKPTPAPLAVPEQRVDKQPEGKPGFWDRVINKPDTWNKNKTQPVTFEKKDGGVNIPPPQFPSVPPAPLPSAQPPAQPQPQPQAPAATIIPVGQLIQPGQTLPPVAPNSSLPLPPPAVPSSISGKRPTTDPTPSTPPFQPIYTTQPPAGTPPPPSVPTVPSVPTAPPAPSMGPTFSPPQ